MSTTEPTDLLLVNRGGESFNVTISTMATIADSDLLLIDRGGASYKITGEDFKASIPGGGGIQPGINDITVNPSVPGAERNTQ